MIVVVALGATSVASAARTPVALYHALFNNEVPGKALPPDVALAVNRVVKLPPETRGHHAVGAIGIDLAGARGPSGSWVFTVFRTSADATTTWRLLPSPSSDAASSPLGGLGDRAEVFAGTVGGKPYTDVRLVDGNVVVQANPRGQSRAGAILFAQRALSYLRTLTR